MQWEKIITQGIPPCERYQHCLHYYNKLNGLILYGGKGITASSEILNDIYILRMDKHLWIKVESRGMEVGARANFASCLHENKLIIFGGVKENMSFSNDTFIFELDQERIEEIIQEEIDEIEKRRIDEELYLMQMKMY